MYFKLIEIAKQDFLASQYLYQGKFFPQALFYIQQSTEKTTKSIAHKVHVPEKNIKESSHSPFKLLKHILIAFNKIIPIFTLSQVHSMVNDLQNESKNLSDKEFAAFFRRGIVNILNTDLPLPFDLENVIDFNSFLTTMQNIDVGNENIKILLESKNSPFVESILNDEFQKCKTNLKVLVSAVLLTLYLNLISNRIVTNVRYIFSASDIIPEDIYTANHPFVELLPTFYKALDHVHKVLSINY